MGLYNKEAFERCLKDVEWGDTDAISWAESQLESVFFHVRELIVRGEATEADKAELMQVAADVPRLAEAVCELIDKQLKGEYKWEDWYYSLPRFFGPPRP